METKVLNLLDKLMDKIMSNPMTKELASKALDFIGIDTDPILGLDIGSTSVKLLLLSQKGEQIRVESYAMEPLPTGAVVEKNIVNREQVIAAIKEVIRKAEVSTKNVCVSIPSSSSITKIIKMSAELNDKEIGSEIELEAERYIPYPLEEVNLDYSVMGPVEGEPGLVNVLLAVSKTEIVDTIVDLVNEAELIPVIVDIDSFAMERSLDLVARKLPGNGKNKIIALFDIGATITTLNVFDDRKMVYTRDQAFGGQHLIEEVQNIYGLKYDEAILAIRYEDLPEDYFQEILEPFKQTVAQQISRFCQFFFSAGNYTSIDYVFLTGGGADIAGLDNLIQSKLQVKTFMANPFSDFVVSPKIKADVFKRDINRLMNCCGLALRNVSIK